MNIYHFFEIKLSFGKVLFFLLFWQFCLFGFSNVLMDSTYGFWTYTRLDQSANFSSISIVDSNVAWLAGGSGVIYRTTDGGKTYQPKFLSNGEDINCIKAIDSLTCFLGSANILKIYKTTNGGINWVSKYSSFFGAINSIEFFDSQNGIALGDPYQNKWTLLKTSDAGESWNSFGSLIDSTGNNGWANSCYWNNQTGFFGTKSKTIFKTVNRGILWFSLSNIDSLTYSLDFLNNNIGFSGHAKGKLNKTTNGGLNWFRVNFPDSNDIGGFAIIDSSTYWTISGNKVYKTSNAASNWQNELTSPYKLMHLKVQTKNNLIFGYAVGKLGSVCRYRYHIPPEIILFSPNGGENLLSSSTHLIKWSSKIVDKIKIEYSTNEGNNWILIKDSVSAASNQYLWTIPSTPSNFCKVRVLDCKNNSVGDTSNSYFSIISAIAIDWQNFITFTDSANQNIILTFGQAPSASDSLDSNLGEQKLPIPVINQFDVRFSLPTAQKIESIKDFRKDTLKLLKWKIYIQQYFGNYPLKLKWNPKQFPIGGLFTMKDTISGNIININLRNDSNCVITDQNVKTLIIERTQLPALWTNQIFTKDNGSQNFNNSTTFGFANSATDSLDELLYENKLPPPPAFGNFDIRFVLPNSGITSLIDYRSPNNNKVVWTLQFQPGGAGFPMTFKWNNKAFPTGNFFLKDPINGNVIKINMKTDSMFVLTSTGLIQLKIEYTNADCANFSVDSLWNIIGVPVITDTMTKIKLFPNATSYAFAYNNGYIMSDTLKTGVGYWIKFAQLQNINFCGSRSMISTIPIRQGWNIIAPFDSSVSIASITSIPENIISSNYFGYNKGYYFSNILVPGKGYWIKASQNGTLFLPANNFAKTGEKVMSDEKRVMSEQKIIITDKSGNFQTLYLTKEQTNLSQYELPPAPPQGIADVRFVSNRFVENITAEQIIKLNGLEYPVKIKVVGTDLFIQDNINGKLFSKSIKNGEEVAISNPQINMIRLKATESSIPTEFSLSQNYPNPFNPITIIQYEIATPPTPSPDKSGKAGKGSVSLKIYDVLGREIETLVNEEKPAGKYSVMWNASKYSSGIYYYELNAGNGLQPFRAMKKMVLIK